MLDFIKILRRKNQIHQINLNQIQKVIIDSVKNDQKKSSSYLLKFYYLVVNVLYIMQLLYI